MSWLTLRCDIWLIKAPKGLGDFSKFWTCSISQPISSARPRQSLSKYESKRWTLMIMATKKRDYLRRPSSDRRTFVGFNMLESWTIVGVRKEWTKPSKWEVFDAITNDYLSIWLEYLQISHRTNPDRSRNENWVGDSHCKAARSPSKQTNQKVFFPEE